MIENLKEGAGVAFGLVEAAADLRRPEEIVVMYPPGSPAAGTEAGRYLLTRDSNGAVSYTWKPTSRRVELEALPASHVIEHALQSLAGLKVYLDHAAAEKLRELTAAIFLDAQTFKKPVVRALIDERHTGRGTVVFEVPRHPVWLRWANVLGTSSGHVDLSHEAFADLLVDNAEDLVDPDVAKMVATFRGAKSISYEASLDSARSSAVKVEFKASGGADSKKLDVQVPRMIVARLPAYAAVWPEGEEPLYAAKFRVRVMASKKSDSAEPVFRVHWLNALDVEAAAQADLTTYVAEKLAPHGPVVLGAPKSATYVPIAPIEGTTHVWIAGLPMPQRPGGGPAAEEPAPAAGEPKTE